jgi:hypothetical protein
MKIKEKAPSSSSESEDPSDSSQAESDDAKLALLKDRYGEPERGGVNGSR